jgi:hypothetical protein
MQDLFPVNIPILNDLNGLKTTIFEWVKIDWVHPFGGQA